MQSSSLIPLVFVCLATLLATLLGGLFALHARERLNLILGFSGGAVLGVVLFDLIPEALALAGERFGAPLLMGALALGFLTYMVIDRVIVLRRHGGADLRQLAGRGILGAASLSLHSFLDGFSIGLAFKVSWSVGVVVAVGVLVHDFSDGINTVSVVLKNGGDHRTAFWWLVCDCVAPVLGALSTLAFVIHGPTLGLWLAVFAGFFLYIGASDLVPDSYRAHPSPWTSVTTILGAVVMFIAIRLVNG